MILENLRHMLSQEWLLDGTSLDNKFCELADFLLKKIAIQKGQHRYYMSDIEFYLFHKEHRDIITYPRNSKAGEWFFHASGVDISFESHVSMGSKEKAPYRLMPKLTEESVFGGILIRGIEPAWVEDTAICGYKDLHGPMKVCNELFDKFDAFSTPDNFPLLVEEEHYDGTIPPPIARYNLLPKGKTADEKVRSILSNNYCATDYSEQDLIESFTSYKDSTYRYKLI